MTKTEMEKKLKIVLICSFSNEQVRAHLPLDNRKLSNTVRWLCRMGKSTVCYRDVASWNSDFIKNFQNRDDVELVVISAHTGLKKCYVHFELDSVKYYFIKTEYANFLKRIIAFPAIWHRLNPMRPIVRKIVRKEHPDIVALMGAENPHISGTILGLENEYPCIFKAQTIYNNPERKKRGGFCEHNAYVERLIFDAIPYASVSTKMHYALYRTFKKDSYNFAWKFGTTYFPVKPAENKEYDFVNFAIHMVPGKGFPDAIEALAIVKQTHPKVTMNLIGTPSTADSKLYHSLVEKYALQDNVTFTPSFEKQRDLFQHLMKSRFAVLPYKMDYISSTTWQAMNYELPVVCYKTLGTPTVNTEKECILIADMDNVQMLAEKMSILLDNPEKAEELRHNAKELVDSKNDGKKISDEIIRNFRAIVEHFNNGTPIPKELILEP